MAARRAFQAKIKARLVVISRGRRQRSRATES
jgi:hypothetical protein